MNETPIETPVETPIETPPAMPVEAEVAERAAKPAPSLFDRVMRFLSSFGLTTVILLCLMVLTFFGTYAQRDMPLSQVQEEYFNSLFCRIRLDVIHPLRDLGLEGWGFRFPGAFLLLILLSVNLICGGIVRIRWKAQNTGILIGHFGIVFLLVAGAVKFGTSTTGHMELHEGRPLNTYISFDEWELAIGEQRGDGSVREYLIPDSDLRKKATFHRAELRFTLTVDEYFDHSSWHRATGGTDPRVIDGIYLLPARLKDSKSKPVPGAYLTVTIPGQETQRGLVRGFEDLPWSVRAGGVDYTLYLRRKVMDLPFALRLKKFFVEVHPGTAMHRHFSSQVVKIEDGVEQEAHIKMNEPLRHRGYMFSQNSFGPEGGPPPYWSVLEVSSNPADQWPKYACFVIAIGLLIHFIRKLRIHLGRQQKLREAQ